MKSQSSFDFPTTDTVCAALMVGSVTLASALLIVVEGLQAIVA